PGTLSPAHMGRVPPLLDQDASLVPLGSRLGQAHLRVLAQGEDVFLAIDLVAVAPQLGASRPDLDEQATLIGQLARLLAWLGLADLNVGKCHGGYHGGLLKYPALIPALDLAG